MVEEMKGNRGEWSEPYAFMKLLGDGRIYAADANLKKIKTMYFPVLKVIGELCENSHYEYRLDEPQRVAIFFNNEKINELDASVFREEADKLYHAIVTASGSSFKVDETAKFLYSVNRTKLKMGSSHKADIDLQVHDIQTGYEPIVGFSIKSQLGGASTLINASKATNFIYDVSGLTESDISTVNAIETRKKIIDRMEYILAHGPLTFEKMNNTTFCENVMLIDSRMPDLLGWALLEHYSHNIKACQEVMDKLDETNPLHYPRKGYYAYKFKKFLCASALGMMPAKPWNGIEEANGGYIIVTKTGDLFAYHIYNREYFETYLLNNTVFDRADMKRHGFCSVYTENGKTKIKLNLQVRFNL